jgi:hypothetical protein
VTPSRPAQSPVAALGVSSTPTGAPQRGYGGHRPPETAFPSRPDPTQIPDAWVAVFSDAADRCFCSYRYQPCCIRAGLAAIHPLWAAEAADRLTAAARHQRQQPDHNGHHTAGLDHAARLLRQHEPGS